MYLSEALVRCRWGGHELLVDDFFVHEFLRLAGHSLLIICKSGRRPRLDTFVWRKV